MTFLRRFLPAIAVGVTVSIAAMTAAQDDQCAAIMNTLWETASNACVTGPDGYICNGGAAPSVQPEGQISNALAPVGALVELNVVDALRTPALDTATNQAGLVWLRLPAPLSATMLLVGDVAIQNVTPDTFQEWTSSLVVTGAEVPECSAAPISTLVLQNNVVGQVSRLVINGASLGLDGTVIVRTVGSTTVFVALSGQSTVTVLGTSQPLLTGQQISVPYNGTDFSRPVDLASAPAAFDPLVLHHLPVVLFPRPVVLPQPGFVRTSGTVNLRSGPSQFEGLIMEVPAGEVMSVLGQNPEGTWYHVQLDTGETGWMLAELLVGNVGSIAAVYEATPSLPQRIGELGTAGRVSAPAGLNLREGPDAAFPVVASVSNGAIVQILSRSPYSQWVKVDAGGIVGWVALIALETQTYYEALPVDYTVGPPPPPTRVPGSFGNAFPNPNGDG